MNKKIKTIFSLCFFVSLFLTTQISYAADINASASRASGVAPLYVFFDATTTDGLFDDDYINADFSWNFDDINSLHNQEKGFVVGHVFESPGEYDVSLEVRDKNGTFQGAYSTTINVEAFSGNTYYIASNGNDSNPGTQEQPFLTFSHAMTFFGNNVRVLLRRGDIFNIGSATFNINNITGPSIIGAYGIGEAPVLNTSGDHWGAIAFYPGSEDIRVMDLHIVGTSQNRDDDITQRALALLSDNCLVLGVEIESVASDAVVMEGSNNAVFDSSFHDFGSYGAYTYGLGGFSFVGNTSIRQDGYEHFYRTQSGIGQFIAHNHFTQPISAKSSIQIRGDGTSNVVVYDNDIELSSGAHPQNQFEEEYIRNVLFESNIFRSSYVEIIADNVVVRNNILHEYISMPAHPIVGASHSVDIYNNTFYVDLGNAFSGEGADININHNIYYTPTDQEWVQVADFRNSITGSISINDNLYYAPNISSLNFSLDNQYYDDLAAWQSVGMDIDSISVDPEFVSIDPSNSNYLKLPEVSPYIDKGFFPGWLQTSGQGEDTTSPSAPINLSVL